MTNPLPEERQGFLACIRYGETLVRATYVNVANDGSGKSQIALCYPLVSGGEVLHRNALASLYDPTNAPPLQPVTIVYPDNMMTRLDDVEVDSVMLSSSSGECIDLMVMFKANESELLPAPTTPSIDYLKPVRTYTWNDVRASVVQNGVEIDPTLVRSMRICSHAGSDSADFSVLGNVPLDLNTPTTLLFSVKNLKAQEGESPFTGEIVANIRGFRRSREILATRVYVSKYASRSEGGLS